MLITKSTEPQSFKPIEIKILIETQEEYDTLLGIAKTNDSIPREVYKFTDNHKILNAVTYNQVCDFLNKLGNCLTYKL